MIIYRPHRGNISDAMREAVEFESEFDMFAYIVDSETQNSPFNSAPFAVGDLVITCEPINDYRIGWEDTRTVCTRRYQNEIYPIPQAIGFCATKYSK